VLFRSQDAMRVGGVDVKSVLAALALLSGSFFVVLLVLRVYLHCMRRQPARRERRAKMTQEDVETRFPVVKCITGGETCVICLSDIDVGEECRVTQCGHAFHADCVLSWWMYRPRRSLRCPMCRTRQKKQAKDKQLQVGLDGTEDHCVQEDESEGKSAEDGATCSAHEGGEVGPLERQAHRLHTVSVQPNLGDRGCSLGSEEEDQVDIAVEGKDSSCEDFSSHDGEACVCISVLATPKACCCSDGAAWEMAAGAVDDDIKLEPRESSVIIEV